MLLENRNNGIGSFLTLTLFSVGAIAIVFAVGISTATLGEPFLVIGAIFALLFALILLLQPVAGLGLLFFARPLIEIFRGVSFLGAETSDAFNPAGILTLLVLGITFLRLLIIKYDPFQHKFVRWYILFLLVAAFSLLYSRNLLSGAGEILRYASYLAIFLLVHSSVKNVKQIYFLLHAILLSSLMPVIYAGWQLATGNTKVVMGIEQLTSFFAHQNNFASFLVISTTISLGLFLSTKKQNRWLYMFYFLVLAFFTIRTYARIGLGGLVISILILLWVTNRKQLLLWLPLGFLAISLDENVLARLSLLTTETLQTNSWIARLGLWQVAWNYFIQNPILGIGIKSYNFMTESALLLQITQGIAFHNLYLQLLTEMGILGLSFFLINQAAIFIETLIRIKNASTPFTKTLNTIFLASFIGIMSIAALDNVFSPIIQWYVWGILGLSSALYKLQGGRKL